MSTHYELIVIYKAPTGGREVKLVFEMAPLDVIKKDLEGMASYPKERPILWPAQFSECRYELRTDTGATQIKHATLNTLLTYIGELEEMKQ